MGSPPDDGTHTRVLYDKAKSDLRSYKNEMTKCAVRGEAVLAQRRIVADAVQTYYSGLAMSKALEQRQKKIQAMREDIKKTGLTNVKREQALQQLDYELFMATSSAATSASSITMSTSTSISGSTTISSTWAGGTTGAGGSCAGDWVVADCWIRADFRCGVCSLGLTSTR